MSSLVEAEQMESLQEERSPSSSDGDLDDEPSTEDTSPEYYFNNFFTNDEIVSGKGRLNILLRMDREIGDEVVGEIERNAEFNLCQKSNHMFYLSQNWRLQIKLTDGVVYFGTKETYGDNNSLFATLDARIVFPDNHKGVTSLFSAMALTASKQHPRKINTDVLQEMQSENFDSYPNVRVKSGKCPDNHHTCAKIFQDRVDGSTEILRENVVPYVFDKQRKTQKGVPPPCLFIVKLCKPKSAFAATQALSDGIYVLPKQLDKESDIYIEARRRGLEAHCYLIKQLENLGEGDALFVQSAKAPWYGHLYVPGRNTFMPCKVGLATLNVIGFYLESKDKVSLQVRATDMLLIPSEGPSIEFEVDQGRINFTDLEIGAPHQFALDDEQPREKRRKF